MTRARVLKNRMIAPKSLEYSLKANGPFRACMPGGKRLPPGIYFFVNIANFDLAYFREFATDFAETPQVN